MPVPESTDRDDSYRPIKGQRKLLVLLLGVTTALAIVLALLYPPGGVKRVRKLPPDAARCADGRTSDCVGGTARVIVVPPASAVAATVGP